LVFAQVVERIVTVPVEKVVEKYVEVNIFKKDDVKMYLEIYV